MNSFFPLVVLGNQTYYIQIYILIQEKSWENAIIQCDIQIYVRRYYDIHGATKYTKPERSLAHVPIMTFIAPINLYITFEGLNCADCANNEKHL